MAKMTQAQVNRELREIVFNELFIDNSTNYDFRRINDRQYGVIVMDANGNERYCRIPVIVAEYHEEMPARDLMEAEIAEYELKQAEKEQKALARAEKAEKDKARRKAEKEAKANVQVDH